MKILTVLTYYRPHTSGLTIYAERLAEAFARRGHEVTVLTSHFDISTPSEEVRNGVRIVRAPVLVRISKGVIMPTIGWLAWKHVAASDVVQMHLPQFDAPGFAVRARLMGKPAVLTYHCDLQLPNGFFNRLVNRVVDFQNHLAGLLSSHIVTYTQDYADHSRYLSRYLHKLTPILPPVQLPAAQAGAVQAFAQQHHIPERRPVIGMATRFASEKGVEILLDALPAVFEKHPKAQVLFAGPHLNVMGEQQYFDRLAPRIREYEAQGKWSFLGVLNQAQMAAFYTNLDVLVVPSLNSTEAFGLVQIEAMMHNVPCVASALPGVRRPVEMTGMGKVSPVGDWKALAESILEILGQPAKFRGDPADIARPYDPDTVAAAYEKLFEGLSNKRGKDYLFLHTRDLPYFRALLRAVESRFYQELDLPSPTLDLGCGDGHFAQVTFDRKLEVGLDPWTGQVREARARDVYGEVIEADGSAMPYPDAYFSSCLSNSVLEHIPHLDGVLAETARVLKTGAPFVFSVPNHNFLPNLSVARFLDEIGLKHLARAYRAFFNNISRHETCENPELWIKRLETAGFKVERYWHYFSPAALAAFEWGHYFGLPSLVIHFFMGKWHLNRSRWNFAPIMALIRKYYEEPVPQENGVYTFYVTRRV